MMSRLMASRYEVSRITCAVHQRLEECVTERLHALGAHTVLVETARCVRQHMRSRFKGLPGLRVALDDSPIEIFRTTVPRESVGRVLDELAGAADLRTPGRGMIYAQDMEEVSLLPPPDIAPDPSKGGDMLSSLTLFTAILSAQGGGTEFASAALRLGVAVPLVGLGTGTGIRNRLGLLRITIPPEKELVHLMVPDHDASGLLPLLIDEGRLDRPGGGFLYETPVRGGWPDPMVRIGRQEHAATMEQVIAALDELKKGTSWRKRFAGVEPGGGRALQLLTNYREITFVCEEGRADEYVRAAVGAGAGGATTARVRCLRFSDREGGVSARERGVICVAARFEQAVIQALSAVAERSADPVCRFQVHEVPSMFSHLRTR